MTNMIDDVVETNFAVNAMIMPIDPPSTDVKIGPKGRLIVLEKVCQVWNVGVDHLFRFVDPNRAAPGMPACEIETHRDETIVTTTHHEWITVLIVTVQVIVVVIWVHLRSECAPEIGMIVIRIMNSAVVVVAGATTVVHITHTTGIIGLMIVIKMMSKSISSLPLILLILSLV